MQFVQMELRETKKTNLEGEIFIHEFKFTGEIRHFNHQERSTFIQKIREFNEGNLLTKFILNSQSGTSYISIGGSNNNPIELHVIQLGAKEPEIVEIQFFLKQLGLENLRGTTRSYSVQTPISSIGLDEYGLTHFLNELFCLEKASQYDSWQRPLNFRWILTDYREIFQALSLQMDLFSTANLNKDGWNQYLKLTNSNNYQEHCFKASFWTEEIDDLYHYTESQRIESYVFDQERSDYYLQLNEQLTCLKGIQSFDELSAF